MSAALSEMLSIATGQPHQRDRVEMALELLVQLVERTVTDSDGHWPEADMGCIDCTSGTVPASRNTGRCAYHHAKVVLDQLSMPLVPRA